jgi:hypothetical protein
LRRFVLGGFPGRCFAGQCFLLGRLGFSGGFFDFGFDYTFFRSGWPVSCFRAAFQRID